MKNTNLFKRSLLFCLVIAGCLQQNYGQTAITRSGFAGFYSKTPFEDIKAENNQVYAVIDAGKKNIAFSMLMKGFIFPKELMQEHFNENYIESDKYPKASFLGNYTGAADLSKDGVYPVVVKGNLTLHNTTRPVETPATLEVRGGKLSGKAAFTLKPEDYAITIPSLVRDKIQKEINVVIRIDCNLPK